MIIPDDGGGGSFDGINPQLLAQLMSTLTSGANTGQQTAGSYVWQFQRLGLDTGALSKLQANYNWASGQHSMLQRRYNLASNQPAADWELGFATAGASYLQWTSPGQAQAAGAQATKDYQDGKISYKQYLALYSQNESDPDWSTGAVKALGHDGLAKLESQIQDTYPPDTADMAALATAVAAAMANGVTFPWTDDPEDNKGSEDVDLLSPLLKYANFPPGVLVTLGNEVTFGGPGADSYRADPVLKAIAANPVAAAQFMAQFKTAHGGLSLEDYVAHGSDHHGMMPTDEAQQFADIITAGTVGAKNSDPKDAFANVTDLVQFYTDHPGTHTYGPIQAAYGNVVKGYWPDVMYSITSTAPGAPQKGLGPDGMKLGPDQWAAFIDEAMRDPGTAASLLVVAHTQAQQLQTLAAEQPGQNAGDAYAFQAGLVNGYFDSQAQTVYKAMGAEWAKGVEDAKDRWAEQAGQAADILVDVVADPGSIAKTITVGVTKDAFDAVITAFKGKIPDGGSPPPKPDYSTWQGAYADQLMRDVNKAPKDLTQSQAALIASAKSGGFMQDGKIDPSTMSPEQLKAYNAWLNSPAVIDYVENGGQNTSYRDGYGSWVTQNSMNSGGG